MAKVARFGTGVLALGVLVGACCFASGPAAAASFDCRAPDLTEAQSLICSDHDLSLADDRVARRIQGVQKRYGLGLYLSIRYWHFRNKDQRDECGRDRGCILAAYRAQNRTLDRLGNCLEGSIRKRSCLRVVLSNEETASQGGIGKARP